MRNVTLRMLGPRKQGIKEVGREMCTGRLIAIFAVFGLPHVPGHGQDGSSCAFHSQ